MRGQVRKGDLLVPSGANDGYAVALDAKAGDRKPSQLAQVFAVAWDSHEEGGEGRVNAAFGTGLETVVSTVFEELNEVSLDLQAQLDNLSNELDELLVLLSNQ